MVSSGCARERRRKLLPLVLALGILVLSTLPRVPSGAASVLFQDGFESGGFDAWTGTNDPAYASPDYSMLVPPAPELANHGTYFATVDTELSGGTALYCYESLTASELYVRGYFRSSMGSITHDGDRFFFITFRASGGNNLAYAGWRNENGVVKWILTLRDGTGYVDVYSSNSPQEGVYTSVELHWKRGTNSGGADLWVDGVNLCSSWGRNTDSYGDIQSVRVGLAEGYNSEGAGASFDCIVFSTSYNGPEPRVFEDGFESGSFSAWTNSATTAGESATVTSARARHGSYSAGFSTNGDGGYENAYCYRSITPMNYLYAR